MSVRRAQEEIDSREFTEWMAYLRRVEPHGAWRDDIHAGIIAATTMNAAGGIDGEPAQAVDYLVKFDEPSDDPAPDLKAEANAARIKLHMMRLVEQQKRKDAGKSQRSDH